ncbi:MAG: hypothetical protein ABIO48_17460 [Pedococcus sp.]
MIEGMDDSATIPYWMAFLIGPVLLAFALWVVPGRLKEARRRLPIRRISSANANDVFDVWFPSAWATGVGAFGTVFIIGGLLRLAGID